MKYRLILGILILILGFSTCYTDSLLAEVSEKTPVKNNDGVTKKSGDWSTQTSVILLPSGNLHGISGDIGTTDYRFKIARNIKLDNNLSLTIGGGYGLKHIDATSIAELPEDLHALYLEAGASYRINDRSFISLRFIPGFYSDFKKIGGDDLRMPVLAMGGYTFDSGISLVGGFVYRFGYHAGQYIPALGVSYQPNQDWKFDLIAPRPAITYFAAPEVQFFVAGDFASDEYELKDHSLGAKIIKYSDLKAMGGCNYLPTKDLKISTSIGYAFERQIMFFDGNRPDMRVDDAPFFRVSLDLSW